MKMMTSIVFVSGLMASGLALATVSPINSNDLKNYVFAVTKGGANGLTCPNVDSKFENSEYVNFLSQVNSGYVDNSGAQPMLTLEFTSAERVIDFIFTTTSDYKTVTQVEVTGREPMQVNIGTVLAPNIVTQVQTYYTDICK